MDAKNLMVSLARIEEKLDAQATRSDDRHDQTMGILRPVAVKVLKHEKEILVGKIILICGVMIAAAEFPNLAKLIRDFFA